MLNPPTLTKPNRRRQPAQRPGQPAAPRRVLEPENTVLPARALRTLELLLQQAEHQLKTAPDLTAALASLVQALGSSLPITYCRVLLLAADGQSFQPVAYHTRLGDLPGALQKSLPLTLLPDGPRLHELPYSLVGATRSREMLEQLRRYSAALGFNEPLANLLLSPLKQDGRLLAVLELGELPGAPAGRLNQAEVNLLTLQLPRLALALAQRLS